jgi:hypothetical protein
MIDKICLLVLHDLHYCNTRQGIPLVSYQHSRLLLRLIVQIEATFSSLLGQFPLKLRRKLVSLYGHGVAWFSAKPWGTIICALIGLTSLAARNEL